MTLTLPMPPKDLSPNGRPHRWKKAKAVKSYKHDVFWLATQAIRDGLLALPATDLVGIRLVCHPRKNPTGAMPDDDNVTGSFKAGRDGLAQALKIDDKRFRYLPVIFADPVKHGRIVLTLHPLTPDGREAE